MSDINPEQVSIVKHKKKEPVAVTVDPVPEQVVEQPAAEEVVSTPKTEIAEPVAEEAKVETKPNRESIETHALDGVGFDADARKMGTEQEKPVQQPKTEEAPKDGDKVDGVTSKALDTIDERDLAINQIAIVDALREEKMAELIAKLYPDDKSFEKASEDPLSFWNLFAQAGRNGWNYSHLQDYISTLINEKVEAKLKSIKDTEFKDKNASSINTTGVDVTGAEAMNAFMSSISGFLRVNLMNSGFWVTLRRPQIYELQNIFDDLELEQRELGYMIGAHYALVADVYIKKHFIELLVKYRIINGSNLEGIYRDDNFVNALSYNDYETIVHAVLTLMSRSKGVRTRVACPFCRTIDVVEDIDIGSCKWVNRDLITDEVRAWWAQTKDANGKPIKRTVADCLKYQREILKNDSSFIETFTGRGMDEPKKIRFNLKVPTMAEFFADGDMFVNKLTKLIDERDVGAAERRKLISANLAGHVYKMILPWIKSIERLDDSENTMFRTTDREPIMMVLDTTSQDQSESIRPLRELEKYVAATRFVWIGMFSMECPHCHSKPDFGFDQFFPLEVQTVFFGHLYRLLPAALTQMTTETV